MPTTPTVSIVILNWNNLEYTKRCIKSLLKIRDIEFNIIVIDNGSKKNEGIILQSIYKRLSDRIRIFRLNKNLGFTGGCNYGLEIAKNFHPEFYLLLNNDTEVEPMFLKTIVETARSNQAIGVVSPAIFDFVRKDKCLFSGGKINWLLARPYHFNNPVTEITESEFLTGCCLLIKSEVLEKVEGMDDRFFAYFEDATFCLNVRRVGYKCCCESRAKVYHHESASSGKASNFYTYLFSRNRILFVRYNTPILLLPYYSLFFFGKLIGACGYFLWNFQFSRAYAYFKGYIDGVIDRNGNPAL